MTTWVKPYEAVAALTDALEAQLRSRHPHLTDYLEMTILVRKLWGGGFDVIGQTYATEADALEAKRAAIMHKLIAADEAPL
jgi:hypothetical protein